MYRFVSELNTMYLICFRQNLDKLKKQKHTHKTTTTKQQQQNTNNNTHTQNKHTQILRQCKFCNTIKSSTVAL